MHVTLALQGKNVLLEKTVFVALFKNSVVSGYAGVDRAIAGEVLKFNDFIQLARKAEIPYPLFFAPLEVVEAQIKLKNDKLMTGFTKTAFSMHSRNRVDLADVELIVKDLLRKQELLRKFDKDLGPNTIVGLLKRSRGSVEEDANFLLNALGLTRAEIRAPRTKAAALEVIVRKLEKNQIFVSRSAKNYMPQVMPAHAKFSGLTLKDKKVPFIFLATGDEGEHLEPAGRKIFTLTLLAVLIARETFAPVNYDGHTKDETSPLEYQLTAEILMPAREFKGLSFPDLQSVRDIADLFMVTPSAVAMRARRLNLIGVDRFGEYMDALKLEYNARAKPRLSSPRPVNAVLRYNGVECSRRMLRVLDRGQVSRADFRRIMFFNKIPVSEIARFREVAG